MKGVYFYFRFQVTDHHAENSRAGTQGQNSLHSHKGRQEPWRRLLMAGRHTYAQIAFYRPTQTMELPTVTWVFLHQFITKIVPQSHAHRPICSRKPWVDAFLSVGSRLCQASQSSRSPRMIFNYSFLTKAIHVPNFKKSVDSRTNKNMC